jgi:hypothetical protein
MYLIDRHGNPSIVLHAVVDSRMRFIHVDAGWAGSTHDARVFRHTTLVAEQLSRIEPFRPIPAGFYLLGDRAYPLASFMLTPIIAPTGGQQKAFNFRHARTRVVVEQAFGRFKGMWRFFLKPQVMREPTVKFLCAATVLHNMCIESYEDWPDPAEFVGSDSDEEEGVGMDDDTQLQLAAGQLPPLATSQSRQQGEAIRSAIVAQLQV